MAATIYAVHRDGDLLRTIPTQQLHFHRGARIKRQFRNELKVDAVSIKVTKVMRQASQGLGSRRTGVDNASQKPRPAKWASRQV